MKDAEKMLLSLAGLALFGYLFHQIKEYEETKLRLRLMKELPSI